MSSGPQCSGIRPGGSASRPATSTMKPPPVLKEAAATMYGAVSGSPMSPATDAVPGTYNPPGRQRGSALGSTPG